MTSTRNYTIDIRHVTRVIRRRKGIVILCALIAASAALLTLHLMQDEFDSRVTMSITEQPLPARQLEQAEGATDESHDGQGTDQQRLAHLEGRIRGRPFLERVIRAHDMQSDPTLIARAREQRTKTPNVDADELAIRILVEDIQSRIRVGTTGPGVYQLTVADHSAERAHRLASSIGELLANASPQTPTPQAEADSIVDVEQRRTLEEKLRKSQAALQTFKSSTRERDWSKSVVRPDNLTLANALLQKVSDEQKPATVDTSTTLEPEEAQLIIDLILDDPDVKTLTAGLGSVLEEELASRLAARGTRVDTWPPKGAYETQRRDILRDVEPKVAELYPDASPAATAELTQLVFSQVNAASHAGAAVFLREAISDYERRSRMTPQEKTELARLESEVTSNRRLLDSFQEQLRVSEADQAPALPTAAGPRIQILDPAQLPLKPARPHRTTIVVMALLLGPLIGLALAFAREALDQTLRSPDDVARLVPEPVLATAPLSSQRVLAKSGYLRRPVVRDRVAGGSIVSPVEKLESDWALATEMHTLATRVRSLAGRDDLKVIMLANAGPGNGTSEILRYLATALAMHPDRKTLAVDLNLREPSLGRQMGIESPDDFFGRLLRGKSEPRAKILASGLPNLHLALPNQEGEDPKLLLKTLELRKVFDFFRTHYDLILVDAPPLSPVADASLVIPLSDGVLLSVTAGVTSRTELTEARELCLGLGARILGLVVNNVRDVEAGDGRRRGNADASSERVEQRLT